MAVIHVPEEVKLDLDAQARLDGCRDAGEYIARLLRQDQNRRAKDALASVLEASVDAEDATEMTPFAWRYLRLEMHRQAGIE